MEIYYITYNTNPKSTNPNQIQIKTIHCTESPKNYCWPGTRLPKLKTNIIYSHTSFSSFISLYVYSTSLNILDTFKGQVQLTLLQNQNTIQQQLNQSKQNLQLFINNYQDQNINLDIPYEQEYQWEEQIIV